jgi:hypothetical protein
MGQSNRRLTRRHFVHGMAGVSAAVALPRRARAEAGEVMARLSVYMSEAGNRPVPDRVMAEAKYHVLDTLAAMISGSELPPGRAALQFARAYGDRGTALKLNRTHQGIGFMDCRSFF